MQQSPFNNDTSEKKHVLIIAKVVGKETEIEVIVVETAIIAGVEITEVETVAIKTKEGMIGNAPNAEIATSRGEILAIDARQNGQLMLDMVVTGAVTVEETVVDIKGTVVVTVEVTVVETVVEIEVETVEETVETEEATVGGTEAVPQNPVTGETVPKAEAEIADLSAVAIDQRLAQIILSSTEITDYTVLPHSVQYNSFLRSSRFILNE